MTHKPSAKPLECVLCSAVKEASEQLADPELSSSDVIAMHVAAPLAMSDPGHRKQAIESLCTDHRSMFETMVTAILDRVEGRS